MNTYWLFLLLLPFARSQENAALCEHPQCNCYETTALCHNLTQASFKTLILVGKFETLTITGSTIPTISSHMFDSTEIERELILSNNNIKEVENDFLGSCSPTKLDMSSNSIKKFPFASLNINSLVYVDLSSNLIQKVPKDAFRGPGKLEFIDLSDNNINYIGSHAFAGQPHLKVLLLHTNKLKRLQRKSMHVDSTEFTKTLEISKNEISYIEPETFSGTYFSNIVLMHNNLQTLEKNVFDDMFTVLFNKEDPTALMLDANDFQCCGMRWLMNKEREYGEFYRDNFKQLWCQDIGGYIWKLPDKAFSVVCDGAPYHDEF